MSDIEITTREFDGVRVSSVWQSLARRGAPVWESIQGCLCSGPRTSRLFVGHLQFAPCPPFGRESYI